MASLMAQLKGEQDKLLLKEQKELVEELREVTPKDTGEASEGWAIDGDSIVNPVEHIKQLNEGSSQQAPAHFIEQTILNRPNLRVVGIAVRDE